MASRWFEKVGLPTVGMLLLVGLLIGGGLLYASSGQDFPQAARQAALRARDLLRQGQG